MKTIAVLTMVFLPATFLATLFSMPSSGWDEPDKFAVYWALALPITVGTLALWALITQRDQISELVRRMGWGRGSKEGEVATLGSFTS